MDYQGVKLEHFAHDGFRISANNKVIYIDPFSLKDDQIAHADYVLLTHEHFDHTSQADIKKIIDKETVILAPSECQEQLKPLKVKEIMYVYPNQTIDLGEIKVETVPAYNLNKFRNEGVPYHPKEDDKVGYIIELNGVRIYHAGDTDNIPEMSNLTKIDLALLPVSGTYVMDWQEAVEAVKSIKPKIAIPMHYGHLIGSQNDAEKFKAAADCRVEII